MIHPPLSILLVPIHYNPFTSFYQSFVPFLFRERITNTCDDPYFINDIILMQFVPHQSPNECLLRQFPQPGPKSLVHLIIPPLLSHPPKSSSPLTMFRTYSSYSIVEHSSLNHNNKKELQSTYSSREKKANESSPEAASPACTRFFRVSRLSHVLCGAFFTGSRQSPPKGDRAYRRSRSIPVGHESPITHHSSQTKAHDPFSNDYEPLTSRLFDYVPPVLSGNDYSTIHYYLLPTPYSIQFRQFWWKFRVKYPHENQ